MFFTVEDSIKAMLGLPDLLNLGLINIHDSVLYSTGSVGEIDLVHPKQKTTNKGMVSSKDSIINHRFKFVFKELASYPLNQQKSASYRCSTSSETIKACPFSATGQFQR